MNIYTSSASAKILTPTDGNMTWHFSSCVIFEFEKDGCWQNNFWDVNNQKYEVFLVLSSESRVNFVHTGIVELLQGIVSQDGRYFLHDSKSVVCDATGGDAYIPGVLQKETDNECIRGTTPCPW